MKLWKFIRDAEHRAVSRGERRGQAMFNHLLEIRPELAEMVRCTKNDPFYSNSSNEDNWKEW